MGSYGLVGEFKGFSYGGPLNEAALAGEVDVIFTADQPAAMLLAAGGDWVIIGRLMYNRTALYVPPESPIGSLTDLKGKSVAMPFGAAAQRIALKAIEDAGLAPETEINSIHLDIYEQTGVIQSGDRTSWGDIDALVGFDPTPAILEYEDKARMLHVGRVVSLVVMSRDFITRHPAAPLNFLRAFREAYLYYACNTDEANNWFREESRLDFDTAVLDIAASVEPNVRAESIKDVRLTLNDEDLGIVQEAADFIYRQDLIQTLVDMHQHIDMSYAEKVTLEMDAQSEEIDKRIMFR
jgi:ABC-type nitrate/sulfonate/bicarbonate transport system substrate-binding protein